MYLESCGYRDNMNRIDPIGESFADPYLGPGVRVPAFVRGIKCIIEAQFVFGQALNPGNEFPDNASACNLLVQQKARIIAGDVLVGSITPGVQKAGIEDVNVFSVTFNASAVPFDTNVVISLENLPFKSMVVVSVDLEGTGEAFGVYALGSPVASKSPPRPALVVGQDLVKFGVSAAGTITIAPTAPGRYKVAFLTTEIR